MGRNSTNVERLGTWDDTRLRTPSIAYLPRVEFVIGTHHIGFAAPIFL
jgi:hypothetical protein